MQTPDSLEEAIVFFRVAAGQSTGLAMQPDLDSDVVNCDFVRQVLGLMVANETISKPMACQEFCEFAVSTLNNLLKSPDRVSKDDLLKVHDFCCTTEIITDRFLGSVRNRVSLASIASYGERAI
jgi:hypothetical protein